MKQNGERPSFTYPGRAHLPALRMGKQHWGRPWREGEAAGEKGLHLAASPPSMASNWERVGKRGSEHCGLQGARGTGGAESQQRGGPGAAAAGGAAGPAGGALDDMASTVKAGTEFNQLLSGEDGSLFSVASCLMPGDAPGGPSAAPSRKPWPLGTGRSWRKFNLTGRRWRRSWKPRATTSWPGPAGQAPHQEALPIWQLCLGTAGKGSGET